MEPKSVKKVLLGLITKPNDNFCRVLLQGSANVLANGVNTRPDIETQKSPKNSFNHPVCFGQK